MSHKVQLVELHGTRRKDKRHKDAMKLSPCYISPQCVLHKLLLLQHVVARYPCNLTLVSAYLKSG